MKNWRYIFLLLVASMAFSSCDPFWHFGSRDDDGDRGYALTGRWFGDFGVYVDGEPARGTVLEFVPESSSYLYGYGTEVDYYYNWSGYLEALEYSFEWEIRDRSIYMYFRNPDLNCRISDYRLSLSYFEGYVDSYGSSTRFKLRNYDRYWGDYGYGTFYISPRGVEEAPLRGNPDSVSVKRIFNSSVPVN